MNHFLYFKAKTFFHGLVVVEDKLSMVHSLEAGVPFLDNDIVYFLMKIPVSLKLGNLAEVVELNENEPGSKTARYAMGGASRCRSSIDSTQCALSEFR